MAGNGWGSFSLDNVTAHLEEEWPWPPRRTVSGGAERPSLGTPAARHRNDRIDRTASAVVLVFLSFLRRAAEG